MALVYLSLGSNIDRDANMRAGLQALAAQFGKLRLSRVYESEAVGFDGENFYNMVVGMHTDLGVARLSKILKQIEDDNGRDRSGPKFGARTLDIDILTYGNLSGMIDGVELPRPEIYYHAFVLWPMAEIEPTARDPLQHKSYAQLWQEFTQDQAIWPVEFAWTSGEAEYP